MSASRMVSGSIFALVLLVMALHISNPIPISQDMIIEDVVISHLCKANPLEGVYHPQRLIVHNPCQTVSGMIMKIKHEPDGDYHISLAVDSQYKKLLNSVNIDKFHGYLVLEIIPLDQPNVPLPKVGSHVTVIGAYATDTVHGWNEIHPVWGIR